MESVLYEKDGPIGWVTLNRPESRNALSMDLMGFLQDTLGVIGTDKNIRVVVIRGNGPAFCAGHDIKEMTGENACLPDYHNLFNTCSDLMLSLHQLAQPVIAQVHGIATAAGCQLVAACDLAIAETGAKFATPGVKIGISCSTPMVPLVRVVGRRRALDMLLSGRFVSADEAKEFGLVNKVTALENLAKDTRDWAMTLADASRLTLSIGKQTFYRQVDLPEGPAYDLAKEAIAENCLAEDAQEGMKAFLEKRTPIWKDR